MTMWPTPEPSRAGSDCEDAPTVNSQRAPNETSDDTLRDFLHSVNQHKNVTNEQTNNQESEQLNATPDAFIRDSNGSQPTSTAEDQQHRKRTAEEELTGQAKRTGPMGRGRHEVADISSFDITSFFDCLNLEGFTDVPPRTFRETKNRAEAINELIDEAPEHKKDITKSEMNLYLRSFTLRMSPTLENGDRRWKVKGLLTPLHTYQAIGAGRIRYLEKRKTKGTSPGSNVDIAKDEKQHSGGILADQMGLGSTSPLSARGIDAHL